MNDREKWRERVRDIRASGMMMMMMIMADLSDFKRGQIVSARMKGASVTKTAGLFGVAKLFGVTKVIRAFEKEKKRQHC